MFLLPPRPSFARALVAALAVLAVGLDSASALMRKRTAVVIAEMLQSQNATIGGYTIDTTYNVMRSEAGVEVGGLYIEKTSSTAFDQAGPTKGLLRTLTFNFTGAGGFPPGQVITRGVTPYLDNSSVLAPGSTAVTAVLGGTGGWLGATGQLTSTRVADGSNLYRQMFEIYYIKNKSAKMSKGKGF